jgi:hypothetical protein
VAYRIRLRAHIEPPTPEPDDEPAAEDRPKPKRPPSKRAAHFRRRRAFFIHVVVDELDRAIAVFFREVFDGWTRREGVAFPDGTRPGNDLLAWASDQCQDLRPGFVASLDVITFSQLGRLLVSRCYRFGVPLVAWDLGWSLSRLAGHVGRSVGGAFSVALLGCGTVVDGKWKDSDFCPRLRITARGSGQPAFVRWLAPRDADSMPKGLYPEFVDLMNLTSAVAGETIPGPGDAAAVLDVEWPRP